MRALYWAYGAATAGSFLTFGVSLYLYGVTASFPVFFARSITVTLLAFILIFAAAFRLTELN